MRLALEKLLAELPTPIAYQLTLLDVDQDPALVDLYDELVPVLFATKSAECRKESMKKLCHYFLDQDKVKEFCYE